MADRIVQILLADDSESDAFFLKRALQEKALVHDKAINPDSFACVTTGTAALANLSGGQEFDLVVLDYYLPERTAHEIVAQLREQRGVIPSPIVVLTSYIPSNKIRELKALNIHNVIQKPSDWQGYQELAGELIGIMQGGAGEQIAGR